jgi:hypothetical protein
MYVDNNASARTRSFQYWRKAVPGLLCSSVAGEGSAIMIGLGEWLIKCRFMADYWIFQGLLIRYPTKLTKRRSPAGRGEENPVLVMFHGV